MSLKLKKKINNWKTTSIFKIEPFSKPVSQYGYLEIISPPNVPYSRKNSCKIQSAIRSVSFKNSNHTFVSKELYT